MSGWNVPQRTYSLVEDGDGRYWIYEDGLRHSRYCVRPIGSKGMQVLEAVVDLLNGTLKDDPHLMLAAYHVYRRYFW